MRLAIPAIFSLLLLTIASAAAPDENDIAARAKAIHESGFVFDGHNDLPWWLREHGDMAFKTLDISKPMPKAHTDLARLRKGGLKAQFWSVYIPHEYPNPARTVTEQIDLVHRMAERYPNDFEVAYTADDVERIIKAGKIASLIGIEGGVAIEGSLAQLRMFHKLGARYMTLTHNTTLPWADAATGEPKNGGLSPFGERVVREMNRLGMLVDISHVSPATMDDVLRVSKAPIIASHSSAHALAHHPRNVPDPILKRVKENGGVIMVNFYSGFIVDGYARRSVEALKALKLKHPDPDDYAKAVREYRRANKPPRGDVKLVADHIDHIVKTAGIGHVGIGSDFDGINSTPEGLDDVSCYPRLTEELLRRGYDDASIKKVLGGNALRVLRRAGEVAEELRKTTPPEVDSPPAEPDDD